MNRDIRIVCLTEALSPITHMSRNDGNESLIARTPMMTEAGVREVPYLSGNAIRHRMLRSQLAGELRREFGDQRLTMRMLNFLFHGGSLYLKGGRENTKIIVKIGELMPMIRLLGASLPSQIIKGSLKLINCEMVCRENRKFIEATVPTGYELPGILRPAEWFIGGYQYTRSDVANTRPYDAAQAVGDGEQGDTNLMIYAGQQVMRHAQFLHGFTASGVSDMEIGALYHGLRLWQMRDPTMGGMSSKGHGRLQMRILESPDMPDLEELADRYEQHVADTSKESYALLCEIFDAGEKQKEAVKEKAAKPKKTKAAKHDPILDTDPETTLYAGDS